jgi:hypothetical protein
VRSVIYSAVIASLLISACGDGGSGPKVGPPSTVAAVSSTTLDGAAGTTLPTALSVKVSDAQGNSVSGAVVNFVIVSGGGSLSATADTTDGSGIASVSWTLGQALGAARAEARVQGVLVPAVFNATIRAGAPSAMQRVSNAPGSSAAGFGMEIGMTVDAHRAGMRLLEVELDLEHRATRRTAPGFLHRARKLRDFLRVYVSRRG